MNIGLFYPSPIPYSADLLAHAPLGGAETAVLRMAAALESLGQTVRIIRQAGELDSLADLDVLVLKRHAILLEPPPGLQIYFWTPDDTDQPSFEPLRNDEYRAAFVGSVRRVLALSQYQAGRMQELGIPQQILFLTRNGIDLSLFPDAARTTRPLRCIYSSTPFRGLHVLLSLWPLIHQAMPTAELHVYSSMQVYQRPERKEFEDLYALARRLPGVKYVGSVAQQRLASALSEARLWLYPNTFAETSCISAMEAQAAGCAIVTSHAGALPETAAGNVFVYGDPLSQDYLTTFLTHTIQLLRDQDWWQYLSQRNRARAQLLDWREVAREWLLLFASGQRGDE